VDQNLQGWTVVISSGSDGPLKGRKNGGWTGRGVNLGGFPAEQLSFASRLADGADEKGRGRLVDGYLLG